MEPKIAKSRPNPRHAGRVKRLSELNPVHTIQPDHLVCPPHERAKEQDTDILYARGDKSTAITLLSLLSILLPGNYAKTAFYLNCIKRPRAILRAALMKFYRFDHVYDALYEAKRSYNGRLSILEFGTNEGYAFRKILYATRYVGLDDRVTVHGFDTFEGMPGPEDRSDLNIIRNEEEWFQGQFDGRMQSLEAYCRRHYTNYELHKGLFQDTLTDEFLDSLKDSLPLLIWIDCDYYSSAYSVLERLVPYLPNGCVIYFDEFEWNHGSRFAGEARLVHEINNGEFGHDIELVLDSRLSLDTRRVYRFMRFQGGPYFEPGSPLRRDPGRSPTNDSPLP